MINMLKINDNSRQYHEPPYRFVSMHTDLIKNNLFCPIFVNNIVDYLQKLRLTTNI